MNRGCRKSSKILLCFFLLSLLTACTFQITPEVPDDNSPATADLNISEQEISDPKDWPTPTGLTVIPGDSADTIGVYTIERAENMPLHQEIYLKAHNSSEGDGFGKNVAISGNTVVVGSSGEDSGGTDSGAAYVFVYEGSSWFQQAFLKASNADSGDNFGKSVAIDENTIVIGASGESSNATGVNGNQLDNSLEEVGAAYVFVRDGAVWKQQAYLKAWNAEDKDYFGTTVAISGNTIVVGATGEDSGATGVNGNQFDNSKPFSGAAYVFERTGSTWVQTAYLKASNTDSRDSFCLVAISGDTIVVGAANEDSRAKGVNGNQNEEGSDTGAAYVFVRDGSTWKQQAYLKASNAENKEYFGTVAISGDTIVVGAYLESNPLDSGAAYIFVRSGSNWVQQAYLKPSNTDKRDFFGSGVAISGNVVIIGAGGESSSATGVNGNQQDNNSGGSGAAYIFVRTGDTWSQAAYVKSSNSEAGDDFRSVAVSGNTIVVGAAGEDSKAKGINGDQTDNGAPDSGAVYAFYGQL